MTFPVPNEAAVSFEHRRERGNAMLEAPGRGLAKNSTQLLRS
jgi:hypothetical protein